MSAKESLELSNAVTEASVHCQKLKTFLLTLSETEGEYTCISQPSSQNVVQTITTEDVLFGEASENSSSSSTSDDLTDFDGIQLRLASSDSLVSVKTSKGTPLQGRGSGSLSEKYTEVPHSSCGTAQIQGPENKVMTLCDLSPLTGEADRLQLPALKTEDS